MYKRSHGICSSTSAQVEPNKNGLSLTVGGRGAVGEADGSGEGLHSAGAILLNVILA